MVFERVEWNLQNTPCLYLVATVMGSAADIYSSWMPRCCSVDISVIIWSPQLMKEIMTPREAAEYLSIHVRTIYRLVKLGEIPGRKVGGSWRFRKDTLDAWLSEKENPVHRKDLVEERITPNYGLRKSVVPLP